MGCAARLPCRLARRPPPPPPPPRRPALTRVLLFSQASAKGAQRVKAPLSTNMDQNMARLNLGATKAGAISEVPAPTQGGKTFRCATAPAAARCCSAAI